MACTVRRAATSDAAMLSILNAEVQNLHAAALPWWFKKPGTDTFSPTAAAALLDAPDNLVFVAELEGTLAGYAYAQVVHHGETPWRYAYEMLYVHQIGVQEKHRRKGVGTALLAKMRAEAAERSITLVGLDVWSFNKDARSFFDRQGFTVYNERLWLQL